MSFHLLRSLISFNDVLFSVYKSCTSFVKFISRYFILFDAMVRWIIFFFLNDVFIYLFLERGEGREKERERNINVWLPLTHSLLGTWPATQACALTGNWTGDPLVRRLVFNLLSHTNQDWFFFLRFYLFLEEGEWREKERETNINVWLPPMWPPLGTWPAIQACALTRNWTGDPLVRSPCSIHWVIPGRAASSLFIYSLSFILYF